MSAVYMPYRAPMSTTTTSPGSVFRELVLQWRMHEFGPEPTMVENPGPWAPLTRKTCSTTDASWYSNMPGSADRIASRCAAAVISAAIFSAAISSADLIGRRAPSSGEAGLSVNDAPRSRAALIHWSSAVSGAERERGRWVSR